MNLKSKSNFTREFTQIAMLLFFIEFVRGGFLIAFLPVFAVKELGFSLSIVGIAVTAHYVADTTLKGYIGYLLDRFSAKWIVSLGLIISFLALFSVPYIHHAWALIAVSALYGIGVSPVWIVSFSRVKEGNRATQMGMLYSFWLAGAGLGPVAINFILDQSYRSPLWLMLGFWLIAWILSLGISDIKSPSVGVVPFKKQYRLLWQRLKEMKPLLPGMILQTMSASMLIPILPSFATNQLGLTYSEYSYVLIAGGACAIGSLIPMGRWSDSHGKKGFLVIGFGMLALGLYLLPLSTSLMTSVILAAVLGISYAAVLPAWNALLSSQVPASQQGLGWGIFASIEGIGVMIGPVLGGWMADLYNENITVLFSASALGVIAIFYLFFPIHRLAGDAR